METSHGMPSFTLNNFDSKMMSKGAFTVLGLTRTKRVMEPIRGMRVLHVYVLCSLIHHTHPYAINLLVGSPLL